MKKLLFACALLSIAAACPEGMTGGEKVAVYYQPAAHWDKFADFVGGHLQFLAAQMKAGNLEYAGPFLKGDDADGGFALYRLANEAAVAKLVQGDPLIREGVATPKIHRWLQCSLAPSAK